MEGEAQMVVSGRPERAAYLTQDSQQTLREGLEEFRAGIPKPFGGNDPSSPFGELFQCHDICHVVFGLSTDLRDEVLADTWAILGTTVGFWRYVDYLKVSDPQAILKEIGIWRSVAVTMTMLPRVLRAYVREQHQLRKKWPWDQHDQFLDCTLKDIRDEFQIRVKTVTT